MNKKLIEKLSKKSLVEYSYSDIDGDNNIGLKLDEEKFAKLIIKDVLKLIKDEVRILDEPSIEDYDIGYNAALTELIETIKNHYEI